MLRTILTIAACSLIITLANSQSKVGSNVLIIDPASMFEVESDSSGILPPRLTTAQRDAQTEWDEGHIIYNSTDHCLQVFNGTAWDCFVQGVQVDSTIYKYNDTLTSDRIVGMGGFQLTFDGSGDVVITDAGFVGIGDPTPEAKLDVEGGTVRLSDYGKGDITGSESYLLGVDSEGDVIEVIPAIDTFSLVGDELRISLKGDTVSYDSVILTKYLDNTDDQIIDSLGLTSYTLEIGVEGDMNGLQTLDLSPLQGGSVGLHDDVDVTTTTPTAGDVLAWDGINFVPQETDNGYTIFNLLAEESGAIDGTTEWSFGNGDQTPTGHGIVIPLDCELWAMSLDHEGGAETTVRIIQNSDITLSAYQVTTSTAEQAYNVFGTPLLFSAGDVLNFTTVSAVPAGTSGRVSAWFRIRATPASNSLIEDLMDVSATGINTGQVLVYNGASFVPGDISDDQIIDSLALVGTNLQIGLESDINGLQQVDLSSLQDGTGTDAQILDSLGLVGTDLQIGIENDANGLQTLSLASLLDVDWYAKGGSFADNILDTIYTFGFVGINVNSPLATLHVVEASDTDPGPWAILEGGGGVRANTALRLYDKGTASNNETTIEFAHNTGSSTPEVLATMRTNTLGTNHANGADLTFETTSAPSSVNTDQLVLKNDGNVGIGTRTPDEILQVAGNMRLDGAFEDKDGEAGTSGQVLTSTATGTDWVNSSTVGTDDQILDSIGLDGNVLNIGIEGDINGLQSVDLSSITGTSDNIYNINGTLTGNRAVTQNNFDLNFDGNSLVVSGNDDRVGIGTANPNYKFQLLQTDAIASISTTSEATDATLFLGTPFSGAVGAQKTAIIAEGLSSWSRAKLHFALSDDGVDNSSAANADIADSKMTIEYSGDVGIGTVDPAARLDVAGGSVKFSNYGAGTYENNNATYGLGTDADGDIVEINTLKNSRWFYAPAVTIDASALVTGETIDLHQEYVDQMTSIPATHRNPSSSATIPTYGETELDYFVTYADASVIEIKSVSNTGVLTYDIIDVPFDNYTIVNIIIYIK